MYHSMILDALNEYFGCMHKDSNKSPKIMPSDSFLIRDDQSQKYYSDGEALHKSSYMFAKASVPFLKTNDGCIN